MPALATKDVLRRLRAEREGEPSEKGRRPPAGALVAPSADQQQGADAAAEPPLALPGSLEPPAPEQTSEEASREAALTLREVATSVGSVRVLEDVQGVWAGGNGATIWDSALHLAGFLQLQQGLAGTRAIELGAGTGLVGMVLAKLGAQVVLTERALALPLLRRNLVENALDIGPSAARAEELSWGLPLPPWVSTGGDLDVVVGSDLVFPINAECHQALAETLQALVGPSTRCWLAYEPRKQSTDESFLGLLDAHGLEVRRVAAAELPAGSPEDLWLLHISAHEGKE